MSDETGAFRVHFQFDGVTGEVNEFVTFTRDEDSEYPSVEVEAEAVAHRVAEETYGAAPKSVTVREVERREDYDNRLAA